MSGREPRVPVTFRRGDVRVFVAAQPEANAFPVFTVLEGYPFIVAAQHAANAFPIICARGDRSLERIVSIGRFSFLQRLRPEVCLFASTVRQRIGALLFDRQRLDFSFLGGGHANIKVSGWVLLSTYRGRDGIFWHKTRQIQI